MTADEHYILMMHVWNQNNRWGRPPRKPSGFDLRQQGEDPLSLAEKVALPCKGGELIPRTSVSTATPEPLQATYREQIPLPIR